MDASVNPFDQFGYDDGGGAAEAPPPRGVDAPETPAPAAINPFAQFGYDDGGPNKSITPAAAPAKPPLSTAENVEDVARSGGVGLMRGAAAQIGMPGDVQHYAPSVIGGAATWLAHKAMDWTGGPAEGSPERQKFDRAVQDISQAPSASDLAPGLFAGSAPTSADVLGGVEKVTGPLPTPQTRAGEYAETIGEFAPAAIGGPGGIVRKAVETAVPAVASETAGQLTKGSPYEQYGDAVRLGAAAVTGAGMSGVEGAIGKLQDYTGPMDRMGFQKPIRLADGTIAQDSYGRPLTATSGQAGLAGGAIEHSAADPAAVRASLANGAQEIVPGSVPTTFQQTGDMGLGQLERGVSAANADRFLQRGTDQNAARVNQIAGIQPEGSPVDVANNFRAVRASMDAEHQTALDAAQQTAQDAGRAIGGVGSTPESIGAGLRDPLVQARAAAKDQENKLWDAVDPTKKMVMPAGPIADAAKSIAGDVTPSATPMAGEEARIFGVASQYGDQMPFREVTDLRSSISTAMRAAQQSGDSQSLRRLTMLKGSVEGSIDHAVENQTALDQIAVRRGTMAPEDTMEAQVQALQQKWGTKVGANAAYAGNELARTGTGDGQGSGGRSAAYSGRAGTAGSSGEGLVRPPSDPGVPPPPPLDADAAARLKAASAATKDRAQTFDQGVVGRVLDRGPGNTFTQSDARVGRTIFHPGPTGGEDLRSYLAAGGTHEAATEAAAASLRAHAGRPDGTFDGLAIHQWINQHGPAINELPPEVRDRFEHSIEAQNQYDEVVAGQRARDNEFRRSAVAPFLGLTEPSSVTRQVGAIFGQRNAAEAMGDLSSRTAADPAARDGLRRAVVDHIQGKFLGGEAGTSGTPQIKSQRFIDFFRANQVALGKVFTPEEVGKISAISQDLERSQRSINATQLKGRSNTVQDYLLTHPRDPQKSILSNIATQALIAGGGHYLAGPIGALTGWLGPRTVGAMRDSGITRIDNLVTEAMLNPNLAKALLTKAPSYRDTGSANGLTLRLRQLAASQANPQAASSNVGSGNGH